MSQSHSLTALIVAALVTADLISGAATATAATPGLGDKAPAFKLDRLNGGQVSSKNLAGKASIIVVARSKRAAPGCKKWMLELIQRYGADLNIYNVVVTEKSWYIPDFVVKNELRNYVPKQHHDKILVEWGKEFATRFGIQRDGIPKLLFIDIDGVIRARITSEMQDDALAQIQKLVTTYAPPAKKAPELAGGLAMR